MLIASFINIGLRDPILQLFDDQLGIGQEAWAYLSSENALNPSVKMLILMGSLGSIGISDCNIVLTLNLGSNEYPKSNITSLERCSSLIFHLVTLPEQSSHCPRLVCMKCRQLLNNLMHSLFQTNSIF